MPEELKEKQREELLAVLKTRFEQHPARHPGLEWPRVAARLAANPGMFRPLGEMERTGGEPDIVRFDSETGECTFVDCSPETPRDRRSLCYDPEALDARREAKPRDSALGMAASMGIEVLTEEQYRALQELGEFDIKTSSWLKTPPEVRQLGGAIFGDRRYGRVFVYHNGAESYYAARGFRGMLKV